MEDHYDCREQYHECQGKVRNDRRNALEMGDRPLETSSNGSVPRPLVECVHLINVEHPIVVILVEVQIIKHLTNQAHSVGVGRRFLPVTV